MRLSVLRFGKSPISIRLNRGATGFVKRKTRWCGNENLTGVLKPCPKNRVTTCLRCIKIFLPA